MNRKIYKIPEFYGIDQSRNSNTLNQGSAYDARNIDTKDGNLSVAKGYVKHIAYKIPGVGPVRRVVIFKNLVTTQYIAISGDENGYMAVYEFTTGDTSWTKIYTYASTVVGLKWDFLQVNIGNTDYLIIANGESQMIKWDGSNVPSAFGTEEQLSNVPVNFIAMHYSRLFAAGNPSFPNRLYWSQIPGDGSTIEDWTVDEADASNSGGYVEVGDTRGDPIVGIIAMTGQILVLKRYSVYTVQGTDPTNFRVEQVAGEVEKMSHTSLIRYGGVAYYLTPVGLYYFNNVTVQPSDRMIQNYMENAYVELSKGAENKDRLYFTCYVGTSPTTRNYDNQIIVYDVRRGTYMIRDGFNVADIVSHDGVLYMVNDAGYLYRMNEGTDYDGSNINAYWITQKTDLQEKQSEKTIKSAYLRGTGALLFKTNLDSVSETIAVNAHGVIQISPKTGSGRAFQFEIKNQAGSYFSLEGGMEVDISFDDRSN